MAFFQVLHYAIKRIGIKGHDTCTGRIQLIWNTNIGHFSLNKACFQFARVLGTYIPVQKHCHPFTPAHAHLRGVWLRHACVTIYLDCTTIRARVANKCWHTEYLNVVLTIIQSFEQTSNYNVINKTSIQMFVWLNALKLVTSKGIWFKPSI